VALYRGFTTFL